MTNFAISLIRAYQIASRSVFSSSCRFSPTCSTYAIDAIRKYGAIKGICKAATRIIRCSPLSRGGYDPVR